MKYEGTLADVQAVEKLVRASTPYMIVKASPSLPLVTCPQCHHEFFARLDDNHNSALRTVHLLVIIRKAMHFFDLKFAYSFRHQDYPNSTGSIWLQDSNISWLCKLSPDMIPLLAKLRQEGKVESRPATPLSQTQRAKEKVA